MNVTATVFNIARNSFHDGVGVRTVVYLKGCNLSCPWCHNPEGLSPKRELMYYKSQCIGCGSCLAVCGNLCEKDGGILIDRKACTACGKCVHACPSGALRAVGEVKTTDEVLSIVMKDKEYFEKTGGGVTVSGGECLLYPDFTAELLEKCKKNGVGTLVESAFAVPFSHIERVVPFTDFFYVDVKHMDSTLHKAYMGIGNERIIENIKRLARITKNIMIRVPVIPGVNDDRENLQKTEDLACSLGLRVQRLVYNNLAKSKYDALNRVYTAFEQ